MRGEKVDEEGRSEAQPSCIKTDQPGREPRNQTLEDHEEEVDGEDIVVDVSEILSNELGVHVEEEVVEVEEKESI